MAKTQSSAPAQEAEKDRLPVEYDVRIQALKGGGSTLATATVDINGAFAVRGVKVMEGPKGPFVSLPSYKAGNGEYKDICFPCTKESREQFNEAVMNAYEQSLAHVQKQNAPTQTNSPKMSQSM